MTGYGEAVTPPEQASEMVRTILEPLHAPASETPTREQQPMCTVRLLCPRAQLGQPA